MKNLSVLLNYFKYIQCSKNRNLYEYKNKKKRMKLNMLIIRGRYVTMRFLEAYPQFQFSCIIKE